MSSLLLVSLFRHRFCLARRVCVRPEPGSPRVSERDLSLTPQRFSPYAILLGGPNSSIRDDVACWSISGTRPWPWRWRVGDILTGPKGAFVRRVKVCSSATATQTRIQTYPARCRSCYLYSICCAVSDVVSRFLSCDSSRLLVNVPGCRSGHMCVAVAAWLHRQAKGSSGFGADGRDRGSLHTCLGPISFRWNELVILLSRWHAIFSHCHFEDREWPDWTEVNTGKRKPPLGCDARS
ncbi:hypothetical protein MAPG_11762, partial [Magnaporthiopsis poae ATCC 64411]